jgi:hypothetical protein
MSEQRDADAGRRGWVAPEMACDPSWIEVFTPEELSALDQSLRRFKATGKPVAEMERADFPVGPVRDRLDRLVIELRSGRGFVVLRGLPATDYSDEDVGLLFYAIGLHLGRPLKQNPRGDLLGHVFDQGQPFGKMDVRGSQTNAFLPFHSDSSEIVGLLCLRPAKSGGSSSVSSVVSVYHDLARSNPELIAPLAEGYRYIRREIAMGDTPVTRHPVPVFGVTDDVVSCRLVPTQIEAAARKLGEPIEGLKRTALDALNALTADDRYRLDMDLHQGDIQFVNNYVVLHSRSAYEDYAEPERKRHMLRLWLAFDRQWPLAEGFARRLGYEGDRVVEIYD